MMRKKVLFAIALLAGLMFPQWAHAYDFSAAATTGQTLYYSINSDGSVSVTPPSTSFPYYPDGDPTGSLVIPTEVTDGGITYSVTGIAPYAFSKCYNLTSVVIPNSVTSIGDRAFYACNRLTLIMVGNSLTEIGAYAFGYCSGLSSLWISSVNPPRLGANALSNTPSSKTVTIPCGLQGVYQAAWGSNYNFVSNHSDGTYVSVQEVCDSYTWPINGVTYTETPAEEPIVTLNGVGESCATTVSLQLTVNHGRKSHNQVTHCGPYTWEYSGQTYNTSGTKYYKGTTPEGCSLRDTLDLTVVDMSSHEYVTHCGPYTWKTSGQTYNKSGVKYSKTVTADGCKHYDTLDLTIVDYRNHEYVTNCGPYTWEVSGQTYNKSGVKYSKTVTADGCKHYDTLTLTVIDMSSHEYVTNCGPYTWEISGQTYNKSGVKTFKTVSTDGCTSYDTLTLTVNYSRRTHKYVNSCGPYAWSVTGETYEQSGEYTFEDVTLEGCPLRDTITLTVNDSPRNHTYVTHCGPYTWEVSGQTYNTSGIKYYKDYTTEGCPVYDTLTLTIVDHRNHDYVTHCGPYTWEVNGQTYNKSGVKYSKTVTADGCKHYDTLTLTIVDHRNHEYVTNCGPYTWEVNGQTYNKSGVKYSKTVTADGCKHYDTLTLTVIDMSSHEYVTNCGSYTWEISGQTYNRSGVKTYKSVSADGCTSYDTLTLTVNYSRRTHNYVSNCGPYTWSVTSETYEQSGEYTFEDVTLEGCPLRDTITLTVKESPHSYTSVTHCGPYTWEVSGQTYNTSGVKYFKSYTTEGCPIRDTLDLTVVDRRSHEQVTHCGPYTWEANGQTYNKSGVKYYKTVTADGCRIYDTLTLTIVDSTSHEYVTNCGPYTWEVNGQTYNRSGVKTYKAVTADGCRIYDTLTLVVNPVTTGDTVATGSGSFTWYGTTYTESTVTTHTLTNQYGCDSIVTLHLFITGKGDNDRTADLDNNLGSNNGTENKFKVQNPNFEIQNLKVFPNPTTGRVELNVTEADRIEVLDLVGRRVAVYENTNSLDLSNLADGTYTLRITLPEGVTLRKVVKR